MIGYLSGPITGHKDYRRQFAKAAAALKEMGYNVINPAAIDDAIPVECMSYEEIMRIDLELLSIADYLVQLPGWERAGLRPGRRQDHRQPGAASHEGGDAVMTLDETYDFLMQIRRKEIIIRRKETQRDELRACLLPGAIRYDRDRVQSTPTDKMADVIVRVDELDREIEQLRREKASLVIEISDAIETLKDDYERTVLTEFYIARAPMTEVADAINYSVRRAYHFRKMGVTHLGEVLG